MQHNVPMVTEICKFYKKWDLDVMMTYVRRSTDRWGLTPLSYAARDRPNDPSSVQNRYNYIRFLMQDNGDCSKP